MLRANDFNETVTVYISNSDRGSFSGTYKGTEKGVVNLETMLYTGHGMMTIVRVREDSIIAVARG